VRRRTHVLIEKPMATSAEDVDRVFARASERGLFAMEGMWMKFIPLHRRVAELIATGTIGTPRHVRAGFGMPMPAGGSRWNADLGRRGCSVQS
jgi:predicted dehydrogenase